MKNRLKNSGASIVDVLAEGQRLHAGLADGAHGAAAEAEIAIGGERLFRPCAVKREGTSAFGGKRERRAGLHGAQDRDEALGGGLLRIRRMGSDAASP